MGRLLIGTVVLATVLSQPLAALAQAEAEQRRVFRIPAGPLEDALNQFGREAGILLSWDPAQVQGLQTTGLDGSYGIRDGLQALIGRAGLQPIQDPDGGIRLEAGPGSRSDARSPDGASGSAVPAASRPDTVLAPVRVTGKTEGTGSYTTSLTNTATKLDMTLRETPQSVTVITHRRMQDQGLEEISEVLDQTTGLYFNNTNPVGADNNFIYSRGFVLDNYQVDGVPRSTRFGFKQDIADTVVYDRVEVIRGASGLLNGVGEPSGSVNLVRKLPTREFQGHVSAGIAAWQTRRAELDVSGPLGAGGKLRGRLVAAHQDANSFTDRVHFRKSVLYGVIEADLTRSTLLTAGFEYQHHRSTGAGGAASGGPLFYSDGTRTNFGRNTNLAADWSFTQRRNMTTFAAVEHFFDNEWRARLDVEQSRRRYDMVLAGLNSTMLPDGSGRFTALRWLGEPQQTSVNFHAIGPFMMLGRRHELVVGASAYRMNEDGVAYTNYAAPVSDIFGFAATGAWPVQSLVPNGATNSNHDQQSGLYLAARLRPTDELSVILGTRFTNWKSRVDRVSTSGEFIRGETRRETAVPTPYAGVVYDLTSTMSVYASYTDIFRPATVYDRNGDLLDPAEGSNLEAGLKFAFLDNRLNLSLAVFKTRKDNVPEYVPNADGSTSYGPTGEYIYRGVDGTRSTGFDLEIAGELLPTWQIGGGFSYTDAKDAEGKPRLTQIPKRQLKVFTAYRPPLFGDTVTVGGNLRWQSAGYTDRFRQGGLAVIDLMAQYRITPKLAATLNVDNLFDKHYYTNYTFGGWYGAPRSAFLTLRYSF